MLSHERSTSFINFSKIGTIFGPGGNVNIVRFNAPCSNSVMDRNFSKHITVLCAIIKEQLPFFLNAYFMN